CLVFFFQAEDGIRDRNVTGVQTCALPISRLTARSMLSLGTEAFFAFWMASYRVGLPAGSPPPVRAATSMFLISRAKSLPRLASMAAFLCFVVAHLECPDIVVPLVGCYCAVQSCPATRSTKVR